MSESKKEMEMTNFEINKSFKGSEATNTSIRNKSTCHLCCSAKHTSNECPSKELLFCYICGFDHNPKFCNDTFCTRCFKMGHFVGECRYPSHSHKFCLVCFSPNHFFDECLEKLNVKNKFLSCRCFSCGKLGHLVCSSGKQINSTKTASSTTMKDIEQSVLNTLSRNKPNKLEKKNERSAEKTNEYSKEEKILEKTNPILDENLSCCNCGDWGHYYLDCESEEMDNEQATQGAYASKFDFCDLCGGRGHMLKFCPNAARNRSVAKVADKTSMFSKEAGALKGKNKNDFFKTPARAEKKCTNDFRHHYRTQLLDPYQNNINQCSNNTNRFPNLNRAQISDGPILKIPVSRHIPFPTPLHISTPQATMFPAVFQYSEPFIGTQSYMHVSNRSAGPKKNLRLRQLQYENGVQPDSSKRSNYPLNSQQKYG